MIYDIHSSKLYALAYSLFPFIPASWRLVLPLSQYFARNWEGTHTSFGRNGVNILHSSPCGTILDLWLKQCWSGTNVLPIAEQSLHGVMAFPPRHYSVSHHPCLPISEQARCGQTDWEGTQARWMTWTGQSSIPYHITSCSISLTSSPDSTTSVSSSSLPIFRQRGCQKGILIWSHLEFSAIASHTF